MWYSLRIEKATLLSLNNKKSWHDHRDGGTTRDGGGGGGVDACRVEKVEQKNKGCPVLAKPARYLWQLFARCEAASVLALFTIYLSRWCHLTLSRWRLLYATTIIHSHWLVSSNNWFCFRLYMYVAKFMQTSWLHRYSIYI